MIPLYSTLSLAQNCVQDIFTERACRKMDKLGVYEINNLLIIMLIIMTHFIKHF